MQRSEEHIDGGDMRWGDKRVNIQIARPYRSLVGRMRRYLERAETFVAWRSAQELPLFFDEIREVSTEIH